MAAVAGENSGVNICSAARRRNAEGGIALQCKAPANRRRLWRVGLHRPEDCAALAHTGLRDRVTRRLNGHKLASEGFVFEKMSSAVPPVAVNGQAGAPAFANRVIPADARGVKDGLSHILASRSVYETAERASPATSVRTKTVVRPLDGHLSSDRVVERISTDPPRFALISGICQGTPSFGERLNAVIQDATPARVMAWYYDSLDCSLVATIFAWGLRRNPLIRR